MAFQPKSTPKSKGKGMLTKTGLLLTQGWKLPSRQSQLEAEMRILKGVEVMLGLAHFVNEGVSINLE